MDYPPSIQRLREKFPWPKERPDVPALHWELEAGGKEILFDLIRDQHITLMLEIGAFLGGSILKWLDVSPDIHVIAVDPWPGTWGASHAHQAGHTEYAGQLGAPEGAYHTFLVNLWASQDRVTFIRGCSPEVLTEIKACGVEPERIFLDSDKSGDDLEPCRKLFPEAILSGDDWWYPNPYWARRDSRYTIRPPVKAFCREHQLYLQTKLNTWVLHRKAPCFSSRWRIPVWKLEYIDKWLLCLPHRKQTP